VDGRPAVLLPDRPPRAAAATARDGDLADVVTSGGAGGAVSGARRGRAGGGGGPLLFPPAPTPGEGAGPPLPPPPARPRPPRRRQTVPTFTVVPAATAAASAWAALANRGMRLVLPEGVVADAVEASRRFLLMFPPSESPAIATAHALYGFVDEPAPLGPPPPG